MLQKRPKSALFQLVSHLILPLFLVLFLYVSFMFETSTVDVSLIIGASFRHFSTFAGHHRIGGVNLLYLLLFGEDYLVFFLRTQRFDET